MKQVVVLLEHNSQDTLEWAAAEAAARSAELRVVYAFRWPYLLDFLGELTVEERDVEDAEAIVAEAIEHVRGIFPSLRISSTVFPGRVVDALLTEARESTGALIVVGHGRRFERRLARHLSRRTTASLAVVGLTPHRTVGPSSGRVVVAVDSKDRTGALGYAFGAARRRGTGLTVVGPTDVTAWQAVYPEVDVRRSAVAGTGALVAESTAAALTVLPTGLHSAELTHLTHGPVVLV